MFDRQTIIPCEIQFENITIVEEGGGFEVNLLIYAEDGGIKVERVSPSCPVMPEVSEGMYFPRS